MSVIDLTTYKGDPAAILALPGATPPEQVPVGGLFVVVVDRGGEEEERDEYLLHLQDSARYDVTLGDKSATGEWETVGWNWEQDHFGSGGRRVVAVFLSAGLAEVNDPALLTGHRQHQAVG